MNHPTLELFTESAWGGLPPGMKREEPVQGPEPTGTMNCLHAEPPEFVETLGFPRGTPAQLLARVLLDIRNTPPGARVQRLLAPGVLSPLFSQSAAEASYALAVLSVVESPSFEDTLARLQSG